MKILVLEGSPHRNGSSHLLSEQFVKGASENGHEVNVVNVAHSDIHPCLGCDYCGMSGPCVQKDDMEALKVQIMESDMLVFVTPLYYFGMSAQLKMVVDRFYSFNGKLTSAHKKTALIAAAWDSAPHTMDDLYAHYQTLVSYLNFEDKGAILGLGCGTPSMTSHTVYTQKAYELGKSV